VFNQKYTTIEVCSKDERKYKIRTKAEVCSKCAKKRKKKEEQEKILELCHKRMEMISEALYKYSAEHNGSFPPKYMQVITTGIQ
jgi:hypothetical protein